MYHSHFIGALILGCAGLLVTYQAQAQARGPSQKKEVVRAKQDAATQVDRLGKWLELLPGDYELDAPSRSGVAYSCDAWSATGMCLQRGNDARQAVPAFDGVAQCRKIGAGPGVRCFFSSNGLEPGRPMIVLFGVETRNPAIRVLSVDVMGMTQAVRGTLTGNRLNLDPTHCATRGCARLTDVQVRHEGRTIEILYFPGRFLSVPSFAAPGPVRLFMTRLTQELAAEPPGRAVN